MKCPNCGLENPDSATVCQCGYSLGTGKADLEKSLAKQAQAIREEVKKIQTVDPDVQAEVGEESARFLSFSIWLYSMWQQLRPEITDLEIAEKASKQGVWAAGVLAVVITTLSLIVLATGTSVAGVEGAAIIDALVFGLVAWGINRKSRTASVLGFSFYLLQQLLSVLDGEGITGGITVIFFVIAFGNSIRGTFAYHKFHAQLRSVIDSETGLSASKIPEMPSLPMPVKLLAGAFLTGFMALTLLGLLLPATVLETAVLEGDQLSTDQRATVESLEILEPDEKIQYFYPWGWVEFSMLTDRSLIIHWSADESPFTAPLQDIISISVDYSDSFFEDSQVRVEAIDRELMEQLQLPIELDFLLSTQNEGDRKFIRALEEATGVKSAVFERADSVD